MSSHANAALAASNLTADIAARIHAIGFDALDRAAVAAVREVIADGVAVAIAGSSKKPSALVADHVREMECKPRASVWGFGFKTSPLHAAYANAVSMHVLDFEPMASPQTHATSPTVPVAFALAEAENADGAQIVAACAKGIEIQLRILAAAKHARGDMPFHTPGIVGVMGSAVTASHMLGLDPARLAHALGIAASRAGGMHANTGTMVKCTHCGNSAATGLEAALLARRGFTANPRILEIPHGYIDSYFPHHFDAATLLDFGRPYRFIDPGMVFKYYPSKYPTHFAITAALRLHAALPERAGITSVRIIAPQIDRTDCARPRTGMEGMFSLQYVTAAALLDGKIGIETFADERCARDDIRQLLERVVLDADATRSKDTRNMSVEVELTLADGTTRREVCTKPPGSWGEPPDTALHRRKMYSCLSVRMKEPDLGRTLELLARLEQLSSHQVQQLAGLLCGNG